MKDYLIVDGYNVINGWPELKNLAQENLEHAREKLLNILLNYRGVTGWQTIVVFDAHSVKGCCERREDYYGIEVIFSRENETADSVIERLVHLMRGERVYVVTSDWEEQRVVFGSGAVRISVRQLIADVTETEREIASKRTSGSANGRLESWLPEETKATMERWRRSK